MADRYIEGRGTRSKGTVVPFDVAVRHRETFNVLFFNINGLQQNGQEVIEAMPGGLHVVALQETRMRSAVPAGRAAGRRWHVRYTDWRLLDNPRKDRGGGGTGFLIRPAVRASIMSQGRNRLGPAGYEWDTVLRVVLIYVRHDARSLRYLMIS